MKQVGHRREPPLSPHASGEQLGAAAQFAETLSHLCPSSFFPKGVFRYKTHEDANRHWEECLARGMAELATKRAHG